MRATGKFGHKLGFELQNLDGDSDKSDDEDVRLGASAAQIGSSDRFMSGYQMKNPIART